MEEKEFIKDILSSKKSNEELKKEYGFESQKKMFAKFHSLKNKYKIKIKSKCSTKELGNLSKALKNCLEILEEK